MKVRIKKLVPEAAIPVYAKAGDAGLDLTATSKWHDEDGNVCYGTGLAFEIPEGYVGLVFPRSSLSKKDLLLSNAVGVIDSGYRGEVTAKFKRSVILHKFPMTDKLNAKKVYVDEKEYEVGERIAQMIILPYPHIEFEESDELTETERGTGGYGSTNK